MFHWGKWKKRMGASASSSKRPVFDEREDEIINNLAFSVESDSNGPFSIVLEEI